MVRPGATVMGHRPRGPRRSPFCGAIVLLNQEPLRQGVAADCTSAMARLERVRARWFHFERKDKPAFARWPHHRLKLIYVNHVYHESGSEARARSVILSLARAAILLPTSSTGGAMPVSFSIEVIVTPAMPHG